VFKYVLLRGSNAGRIYALIGLRRTSPWFFRAAVQPFRIWPGDVVTIFGCVGGGEPLRHIVSSDKNDPVRLRAGETLREWWLSHRPGELNLDVIGGGYTSMFFDWTGPAV
jgi:hypothetical protein